MPRQIRDSAAAALGLSLTEGSRASIDPIEKKVMKAIRELMFRGADSGTGKHMGGWLAGRKGAQGTGGLVRGLETYDDLTRLSTTMDKLSLTLKQAAQIAGGKEGLPEDVMLKLEEQGFGAAELEDLGELKALEGTRLDARRLEIGAQQIDIFNKMSPKEKLRILESPKGIAGAIPVLAVGPSMPRTKQMLFDSARMSSVITVAGDRSRNAAISDASKNVPGLPPGTPEPPPPTVRKETVPGGLIDEGPNAARVGVMGKKSKAGLQLIEEGLTGTIPTTSTVPGAGALIDEPPIPTPTPTGAVAPPAVVPPPTGGGIPLGPKLSELGAAPPENRQLLILKQKIQEARQKMAEMRGKTLPPVGDVASTPARKLLEKNLARVALSKSIQPLDLSTPGPRSPRVSIETGPAAATRAKLAGRKNLLERQLEVTKAREQGEKLKARLSKGAGAGPTGTRTTLVGPQQVASKAGREKMIAASKAMARDRNLRSTTGYSEKELLEQMAPAQDIPGPTHAEELAEAASMRTKESLDAAMRRGRTAPAAAESLISRVLSKAKGLKSLPGKVLTKGVGLAAGEAGFAAMLLSPIIAEMVGGGRATREAQAQHVPTAGERILAMRADEARRNRAIRALQSDPEMAASFQAAMEKSARASQGMARGDVRIGGSDSGDFPDPEGTLALLTGR